MTHCVHTAPPPPKERPSFMLSHNCGLFSLDGRPGLFHFLLTNLSLPSLWAPLSSLLLIWKLCLKSGYFYYCSNLVLEHSAAHCTMMWPWAHILELLWGRSHVILPSYKSYRGLPCACLRAGHHPWGAGEMRVTQKETELLRYSQVGLAVSEGHPKRHGCQESASRGCSFKPLRLFLSLWVQLAPCFLSRGIS